MVRPSGKTKPEGSPPPTRQAWSRRRRPSSPASRAWTRSCTRPARAGKVHLLIHAADAGEDGNRTLDQAWRVGGGEAKGLVFPLPRTILSMALGRENVVHIALTDAAAARRVARAISRWQAFIDPDAGLDGGDAVGPGSTDVFEDEGNA